VKKGDPRAPDPRPGLRVDQLRPGLLELGQGRLDIGHLVGDVVQPRALAGEELADRRVGPQGSQQLDVVLTQVKQNGLDPLLGDDLAVGQGHLEAVAVELERGLELLDGYSDVVDAAEHPEQSIAGCCRPPRNPPAAGSAPVAAAG